MFNFTCTFDSIPDEPLHATPESVSDCNTLPGLLLGGEMGPALMSDTDRCWDGAHPCGMYSFMDKLTLDICMNKFHTQSYPKDFCVGQDFWDG